MTTQNNSTSMEPITFQLPAVMDSSFTSEDLADDMEGLQMNFQRIKIPSGGNLVFEIPTDNPENPNYEKTIEGVLIYHHDANAYWPEGSEYDENTAPLCSSVNGKQGIGEPGGLCVMCGMNQYGTAPEGRGKACKNMRMLYLLRSGECVPIQISLPPTSLKPFKTFINQAFLLRRRPSYGSVIQLGLRKENTGGNDYSVATFRLIANFEGEELAQIRSYAEGFKEQIKLTLKQRAETAREQFDDGCDYVSTSSRPAGAVYMTPSIDGDREALPA
ncbi:MAG: hypothetical protein NC121_19775 [Blautia sp.]|nr:hypothetical protein [Bacteroides sp.]MCM1543472.1 hypothetical protein [Blautia sp.]